MVVTHDPRPPYREDPRDAYLPPSRNMLDTASAFWMVVAAALAAVLLIWLVFIHAGSVASAYGLGRHAFRRNAAHNTASARASNKARANSVAEPEPSPGAPVWPSEPLLDDPRSSSGREGAWCRAGRPRCRNGTAGHLSAAAESERSKNSRQPALPSHTLNGCASPAPRWPLARVSFIEESGEIVRGQTLLHKRFVG